MYSDKDVDVISILNNARVGFWCLDLDPVVTMIEKHAMNLFRENKDSMKVIMIREFHNNEKCRFFLSLC